MNLCELHFLKKDIHIIEETEFILIWRSIEKKSHIILKK